MDIAQLIIRAGKTQGQVAKEVGITRRALYNLKSGKADIRKCQDSTVIGLARSLNISVEELIALCVHKISLGQDSADSSDE